MHKHLMCFSYAKSIPLVDETNNYQLYVGMHPEDHIAPHTSR